MHVDVTKQIMFSTFKTCGLLAFMLFIHSKGHTDLKFRGRMVQHPHTVSTHQTLDHHSLILADSKDQDIELTLPSALSGNGYRYMIKKTSHFNDVIIKSDDGIDQCPEIYLPESTTFPKAEIISDGNSWHILSEQSVKRASSNLLIWWKLNKAIDDDQKVNDDSENGREGLLNGISPPTQQSDGTYCDFPGSLAGSSNTIKTQNLNLPNGSIKNCSVSIWFKASQSDFRFNNESQRYEPQHFLVVGAGNLVFGIKKGQLQEPLRYHFESNSYGFQSGEWQDNTWTHLLATWDGINGRMIVYENGDMLSNTATHIDDDLEREQAFPSNQNHLNVTLVTLGARPNKNNRFKGQLDDFRLYNYCLSPAEVKKIYQQDRF